MNFTEALIHNLNHQSNTEYALQMKAYLRHQFEFFGIKTPLRRAILNHTVKLYKKDIEENIRTTVLELLQQPQRELHHCGIELFEKHLRKSYQKNDIEIIETLITTNSWWDTVDFIAKQILGTYLIQYPEATQTVIEKYSVSTNMWVNRSSILFQLGYKHKTDEAILFNQCLRFKESDLFFIQKAIGWSLREYGKTYSESVLNFVNSTSLKPLSQKEALRNII
ncbi:DNA alkylation repair protein [Formosa maritima]|uniref:DNA alkylation repair protein n=1 Tax=Formosa maritima TaxID=2592046 RepID=A0A5D0GEM2_9FLAO|nr:DNA alkylation repair protein [Formosa maritima]TYA57343.1 DNA alkylation repair protein [Formosa maritima]